MTRSTGFTWTMAGCAAAALIAPLPAFAQPAGSRTDGLTASVPKGWSSAQGAYVAKPGAAPLRLKPAPQDFELELQILCTNGCNGGILLQPTDGGDPILLSLAEGSKGGFLATLGKGGAVTKGAALEGGPNLLMATPVPARSGSGVTPPPYPPQGAPTPRANASGGPAAAGGAPRPGGPPPGFPAPPPIADGWHNLQVKVRFGVLSARIDDKPLGFLGYKLPANVAQLQPMLLADAKVPVSYRIVSMRDRIVTTSLPQPKDGPGFTRRQLSDWFLTEAIAIGDVNRDGKPDVAAGPNLFLGPDFDRVIHIYPERPQGPASYQSSAVEFVADFTGDGWGDVLEFGLPNQAGILYVNPKGVSRYWESHAVIPAVASEIGFSADVDGDGKSEIVFGRRGPEGMEIGYASPDPANPTAEWRFTPVSSAGRWNAHGLGVGDVDGDGRPDIVNGRGWWQAPATRGGAWREHPADLGNGAEMFVEDIDGDRQPDIVTSLDAHGWGLGWFKGVKDTAGAIRFEKQLIMGDPSQPAGDVVFSELHGLSYADMDGDGLKDIVTGKRWWSHLGSEMSTDTDGDPVVYWFKQVRTSAGVRFEPHLVGNQSGVGTQMATGDLNGDGKLDVAVSGRRGTFLFMADTK